MVFILQASMSRRIIGKICLSAIYGKICIQYVAAAWDNHNKHVCVWRFQIHFHSRAPIMTLSLGGYQTIPLKVTLVQVMFSDARNKALSEPIWTNFQDAIWPGVIE